MKDKLYIGLLCGLITPFLFIILIYFLRFNYISLKEFFHQAVVLKVHFKIVAVSVFFSDLGIFYLFNRLNKDNASKGVIFAVFIFFFIMLFSGMVRLN